MADNLTNEAEEAASADSGALSASAAAWQIRATAWELLSVSLAYPTEELVAAVVSGEWTAAAREVADVLELGVPAGAFEGVAAYAGADERELFHTRRTAATYLFVGAPTPAASPYEGIWRAEDEGVDPLLFVNPHSVEVEHFLRECCLGHPEGTNEPLDHASTECSLLEFLAGVEAGIMELPAGKATADLPGGSAAAAYEQFLADHAQTWLPRFAEKTVQEAREPFYRAVAELLAAMLKAACTPQAS